MNNTNRTWLEINRNAFYHNINAYHTMLAPQKTIIGVVIKANAYGHGLREIGQLCQENDQVSYLFVATLSEALLLRQNGISKPILVLAVIDGDPSAAIMQQIELVVYDIKTINALHALAMHLKKPCIVHLKVDTGLGRLGVMPDEAVSIASHIRSLPFMHLNGIYSHLAQAAHDNQQPNQKQSILFQQVLDELQKNNIEIPYRHMGNSAGCIAIEISRLNLVRLGAGAYGLIPSSSSYSLCRKKHKDFSLLPILSWHTRIMHIRTFPAGTSLGYDATYITTKKTTIALLPVGYADGYNRRLSNNSYVYLQKQQTFVPVVARIGMNLMSIDITNIDAAVGDEIVLLGKEKYITPHVLAEKTESFNPRVITTEIHGNLPRLITESEVGTTPEIPYTKNTLLESFEK